MSGINGLGPMFDGASSISQRIEYQNLGTANSSIANSCFNQLGSLLGLSSIGTSSLYNVSGLMGMASPLASLMQFFGSGSSSGSGILPMQLGGMYSLPPVGINIGLGLSLIGTGLGGVTPLLGSLFGGSSTTSATGSGTAGSGYPRTSESLLFLSSVVNKAASKEYNAGYGYYGSYEKSKLFIGKDETQSGGMFGAVAIKKRNCIKGEEAQIKFNLDMSNSLREKLKYEERRDYKELSAEAFAEAYTNYFKSNVDSNIDVKKMKTALTKAILDPELAKTKNKMLMGFGYNADSDYQYLTQHGININDISLFRQYTQDVAGQVKDQVALDNKLKG